MSESTSYPLHEAALGGDIDTLNRLLEDGANIDARDDTGRTPLFCAARSGEIIAARHLLKRGARVDCATDMGTTALVTAARGGHAEMARLLMTNGADPNQIVQPRPVVETLEQEEAARKLYELGNMPIPTEQERSETRRKMEAPRKSNSLAAAIMSRDSDTIMALLEGGADVNNASGLVEMPPLRTAVSFAEPEVVRLLIQHGALVNAGADSEFDYSALGTAVMKQRVDIARVLLEAGADPNTSGHMPPLAFAVQFNNLEMAKLLLEFGADPWAGISIMAMARNKPEMLALFAAHCGTDCHERIQACDTAGVLARLDAGADIDVRDDRDRTALMLAAEAGHVDLVKLLLDRGADVNAADKFQITPLMYGVRKDHADVVRVLLARGVNVNATNKWGQTAFTGATSPEKREIRDLLIDAGTTIGIVEAAQIGDNAKVMAFLADGVSVNHTNPAGTTALMAAAARGDIELATVLHDRGADLSPRNSVGDTAFHCAILQACGNGDTALLALLLGWGADIHDTGKRDSSLLQTPTMLGSEPVLRFLLERGANPNGGSGSAASSLISTVVMVGRNKLATIRTLLEYGADIEAADRMGSTPLMRVISLSASLAEETAERIEENRAVTKLLIDKGADVNAKDRMGTVLAKAIEAGDVEIVRLLLDAGAVVRDPDDVPRFGRFPAISRPEMTALLRGRGAKIPEPGEPAANLPEGFAAALKDGKMPPDFMSKMLDEMNERRKKKGS